MNKLDLFNMGDEYFLYASDYRDNIKEIRDAIYNGYITVTVDYSRWATDKPQDSVIYRVKVIKRPSK